MVIIGTVYDKRKGALCAVMTPPQMVKAFIGESSTTPKTVLLAPINAPKSDLWSIHEWLGNT